MDKTYEPADIEREIYRRWESEGCFRPSGDADAPSYCIMLPPPNVTGTLHMGHAFQDTIMDALIRYHRMRGHDTLWQGGMDHAGIATQMVVERQLEADGRSRHDLGREAFVERVWEWKGESGGMISNQTRRLGASIDWSRERFTMDEGLSEAVTEVFVRLYQDGLIYRGERLVNWDPVLHTALSDLEVISEEESGKLWHLRYPLSDGSGHLVVATTRPETMLGDTAVAVHPEDERYAELIGKTIALPLCDREIPIIADDYVDPEFGTGCVKITPAHDFNDYEVGKRHDLPMINVLTDDARINDEAPEAYRGLDRYEARDKVVSDFEAAGLLEGIDDHKLMVPRGDRSGAVVEPYLTDQWYVDLTREEQDDGRPGGWSAITKPALDRVAEGSIEFVPGNWKRTYDGWLENIQDWCISRQLWWGHRIPAWYDADGNIYVGRDEAEARAKAGLADDVALTQDDDVLDTWFSSALWPFSTLGWPQQTPELGRYYPTDVLVTGFDIIFFWVARMVMMGEYFMGDVPFRQVYIHGLIRDADGQKMSKSKGNVLDPLDLIDGISLEDLLAKRTSGLMQPHLKPKIEKATKRDFPDGIPAFGTDALRFTFAALATTGRDIRFDLGRVEGYRNFCNKLWNASRYVLINTEGEDCGTKGGEMRLSLADRWILSRFERTLETVETQFAAYRFDLATQAIYEFTWHEFCDWYLELAKPVLAGDAIEAEKRGTRNTLIDLLERLLRLIHPIMPFITEAIWQKAAPVAGVDGDTIMALPYPAQTPEAVDAEAEADMAWVQQFILGIRQIRGEMDIAPGKPVPVLLRNASEQDKGLLETHGRFVTSLARLESVEVLAGDAPECAVALLGDMEILVPLAGLVDAAAEVARLEKRIQKLEGEIAQSEKKLANEKFVANAPAEVVDGARAKLAENQASLSKLQDQRETLAKLV